MLNKSPTNCSDNINVLTKHLHQNANKLPPRRGYRHWSSVTVVKNINSDCLTDWVKFSILFFTSFFISHVRYQSLVLSSVVAASHIAASVLTRH